MAYRYCRYNNQDSEFCEVEKITLQNIPQLPWGHRSCNVTDISNCGKNWKTQSPVYALVPTMSRPLPQIRNWCAPGRPLPDITDNNPNFSKNGGQIDPETGEYINNPPYNGHFINHDDYLQSRNKTIIDVLYSTGCRVSELCDINLSDMDLDEKYLKLKGKGSKQRIVPIGSKLHKNLIEYLKVRSSFIQNKEKTIFLSKSKNKLDRTAVFRIIKKTAMSLSLQSDIYPHTLRHSAATHMLEGGCDLRTVQEFLGHSSVSTTQIYTKVTKEFLEEAFIESHPRS